MLAGGGGGEGGNFNIVMEQVLKLQDFVVGLDCAEINIPSFETGIHVHWIIFQNLDNGNTVLWKYNYYLQMDSNQILIISILCI